MAYPEDLYTPNCTRIGYSLTDGNSMQFLDFVYNCCMCLSDNYKQQNWSKPMVWIGIYISLAALICTLAMATDVIQGLRHKKLWFPCKAFPLNAASLTLLAVAVKIPMDLSTYMLYPMDQRAKFTSLSFLCTAIGHFMPSMAPMTNNELVVNLTALGILVITVTVNICIQFFTGAIVYFRMQNIIAVSSMLLLLVLLSFLALSVPTFKEILELRYHEKLKMVSAEEEFTGSGRLKQIINKYWIMAESGSPQFVIVSSVTCAASGAICLVNALNLASCWVLPLDPITYDKDAYGLRHSEYKYSTYFIAWIQTIGVAVGTLSPAIRWVTAITFQGSRMLDMNKCRNAFKTERYWVKRLVDWKERPLSSRILGRKHRKLIQGTKAVILNTFIGFQIVTVVVCKLVGLLPMLFITPFSHCFKSLKKKNPLSTEHNPEEWHLSSYVLELEVGENKLSKTILKNMLKAVDEVVKTGKKQQPKNLLALLQKCANFKGLTEVDSEQVPSLLPHEPPKCWNLLVVTLTSIAIALPNITSDDIDRLLCSVAEGLSYVRHIERSLHNHEDLVKIENETDLVWSKVELYHEWLDEDLHQMSVDGINPEENLKRLGEIAESRVLEFRRSMNGDSEKDFGSWPIEVLAANSMYRTSQTIILKFQAEHYERCVDLFDKISIMIAGVIGACLTNLPRAIIMKCHSSAIDKREESVEQASILLGETEKILKILQQQQIPSLERNQKTYLDDWVLKMKQGIVLSSVITSSNIEITTT